MPPEPCVSLCSSLAPAQLYVFLAISVATGSWLLPQFKGNTTAKWLLAVLITAAVFHVVAYNSLAEPINIGIHTVMLAAYMPTLSFLGRAAVKSRIRTASAPPNVPER